MVEHWSRELTVEVERDMAEREYKLHPRGAYNAELLAKCSTTTTASGPEPI